MQDWRDSLTSEEKISITQKKSIGMHAAYKRKGNWNLGSKRTDEQKIILVKL